MSKSILLAAAAVIGATTVAAFYYTTPIGITASETPPILVDASPAEVVRKIRTVSLENYLMHAGTDSERALEAAEFYVSLGSARAISDTDTVFDLMRGDDHLMQFRITVKPAQGGKSEVDVEALAGESRFSSNPALHPYDVELLLSGADFLATDYVSSILKGHPMLTGKRLEQVLRKRYALEEDAAIVSLKRIKQTFQATYLEELKEEARSYAESDYEPGNSDHDVDADEMDSEAEPASDVTQAEQEAAMKADAAARAATAMAASEGY